MKFKEYNGLDLSKLAVEILEDWESNKAFEKSIALRKDSPQFIFYEGPPSANGMPGIHHVMARSIKDIFCRYKTLKGFQVNRKAGWDTHGLPIELSVEKELGITKEDIGKKISIEEYNKACKKAVMKYTGVWNDLTRKMGYWVDMSDPYITYESKYIESVWWLLKELYNKKLIYKGYTIQPYSPKAGTGLSSHELNQPGTYQDVSDTTVTAQFKTIESSLPKSLIPYKNLFILAWTTTPWTLPSNTALTVGSKIDYAVISTFNQYTKEFTNVILAKDLVSKVFGNNFQQVKSISDLDFIPEKDKKIPFYVNEFLKGKELVDIKYEQIWNESPLPHENPENAFRVIEGDFVTTEDGTGIVHTAPTFGADDARVAKLANPPIPALLILDKNNQLVPLVNLQGKFVDELGFLGGKYVKNEYYEKNEVPEKSVDVEIAIKLKEENRAFKVEKYVHSYPNCWRTDKPILYYPLDSWFIKVTEQKDKLVDLNKTINWKPKSTGEGRFGNWLINANDWNLSRSRFWGIPLPIWKTSDSKETLVIGSMSELKKEISKSIEKGYMKQDPFKDFDPKDMSSSNYNKIDLHKNVIDKIVLCSPEGEKMFRESDLIDVWFDSGSMPYAQWHYPFENKSKIENNEAFPADYIAEGVDQTRGWFYTLHTIAGTVFNSVAYKNVISNGLVLDKNGQKMSKRLGNAVDPFETISNYGPDATRWYMISNANPWDNLKFDIEGIEESKRKFFGTLYNVYSFFALYANIDKFNYSEKEINLSDRPELDRWIISELNSLIFEVDNHYENYEPTKAARAISDFVQLYLSNWYVRLSRRRFWKGSYEQDKISAYQTLYKCLIQISIISSPIAPFFMDRLYKDLTNCTKKNSLESVHHEYFPVSNDLEINATLQNKIRKAQTICSLVLSLRKKEKIKVRQPLSKVMIPFSSELEKKEITDISDLIKSEVNVKEIELIGNSSGILIKKAKPNFKTLGPKLGKKLSKVIACINELDDLDIEKIELGNSIVVDVEGEEIILEPTDLEIISEDIEGWLVASEKGITVALDIKLNERLINEGICRELVNKIQTLRKDSGLQVTDKIILKIQKDNIIEKAIFENQNYILNETLAESLEFVDSIEDGVEIQFDNINSKLYLTKIE
ncbi:MAG: isoleucine--tRNA ligase [Flavobacteriales bacterium]|nr:MAG: isoleucine--tRNA ligase [Flavobacteriales bacterium]